MPNADQTGPHADQTRPNPDQTRGSWPEFTLVAYRFSADVPAMARFLDAVGLGRVVRTTGDGFVTFAGASGGVAVHSCEGSATGALPGDTQLSFDVPVADAAMGALRDAGLSPRMWDESYNRTIGVDDSSGRGIWINEVSSDNYGYATVPVTGPATDITAQHSSPSDIDVVAVHPSDDFEHDRKLFAAFGFEPVSMGSEHWQALRARPGNGTIGLHPPFGESPGVRERTTDNPVGPPIRIDLGFETDEPMGAVASRLVAAGYADARVDEQPFGSSVVVTDPDGCSVQIHPRSR